MSLKDAIKSVDDRPLRSVWIEEWGQNVYYRKLTLQERAEFLHLNRLAEKAEDEAREKGETAGEDAVLFRPRILARFALDEHGERVFTEDDVSWLAEKSPEAMEPFSRALLREIVPEVGEESEAGKDSDETLTDSPSTESPAPSEG